MTLRPRALFALVLIAGCGGGPQLSNLRCRQDPCQHSEDPLKLLLAVDFADESGSLDKGALELRLNGATQQIISLADVFAAQGLAAGARKGTIALDDDLVLDRIGPGQQVSVGLLATDGAGHDSNQPTLTFTLKLGGP